MIDRFAHQLRLDQIRDGERLDLVADDAERAAIAKRLQLPALERLEAHVAVTRTGDVVRAEGRLIAAVEQSCVVTAEPVPARLDEPFAILFVPEPPSGGPDEEIELGEADCDTVFYDGAAIALGDAIADTLALAIDPYPRKDGVIFDAPSSGDTVTNPFAALAALRKPSRGKSE